MTKKFELATPTTVKLKNAQSRPEHHGEALVLAMDLRIVWTTNNRALDMLTPALRDSLFLKLPVSADADDDGDEQQEIDLPVSERPFIALAKLKYPVKWEDEMTGYTLRLDYGLGGASDTVVNVCVLKNFAITPVEGGSVEIEFTVSSSADIGGDVIGRFAEQQQKNITITLLAPTVLATDLIDVSRDGDAPGTEKANKKDKGRGATEDFIAQHTPADGAAAH